ncbi:4'-phosphopantetheinyl transferase family protein [Hallella multisaccharivorax]|uniref:4'-phosphopantetheinyl transferase family protein n=1 Tax=Hallella multisaccharivorax TaxID=310514 RepID=UPI0036229BC4
MPLFRIQKPDRQTGIAIWQMTESLESLPRPTQIDYGKYGSPHRLQEILTEYLLLQKLTGQQGLVINHRPNGAPLVNGYHVSITHTKGWAAMMLSEDHSVGIDIEYISDRVDRITSRFLRPDEQVYAWRTSGQLVRKGSRLQILQRFRPAFQRNACPTLLPKPFWSPRDGESPTTRDRIRLL